MACIEWQDLLKQITEMTTRIATSGRRIKELAGQADVSRRRQTMPGVGPLTALVVEEFAPPVESFECGRDFAAWLVLVRKQQSSGDKEWLGRVSKAGQSDIRLLLIIGATSRLKWMGQKSIPDTSWLASMLARKRRMLVAIASANKMARTIRAMLTKHEDYRPLAMTNGARHWCVWPVWCAAGSFPCSSRRWWRGARNYRRRRASWQDQSIPLPLRPGGAGPWDYDRGVGQIVLGGSARSRRPGENHI